MVNLFVLFLMADIDMPSSESCPHWQKDVAPPLLSFVYFYVCAAYFRPRRISSVPFFVHADFRLCHFSSTQIFVHAEFRPCHFPSTQIFLSVLPNVTSTCIPIHYAVPSSFRKKHLGNQCVLAFVEEQRLYVRERPSINLYVYM